MATYEIIDEFDTTVDHYWHTFFSQEYNDALWPVLHIACEVLRFERQGEGVTETIFRVQRLTPKRELPPLIQKLVAGAVAYTETNHFSRKTSTIAVETIPSFLADKVTTKGTYQVRELAPNKVQRVWQGVCECTIPLVGRKIEAAIIDEVRHSYGATTSFTRTWLREHPAS